MVKCPLTRCCCYSCGKGQLKKTENYGYDNLGENSPHFDFSLIDYSVMAGGHASRLG